MNRFRYLLLLLAACAAWAEAAQRVIRIEHQRGYVSADFIFAPQDRPTAYCDAPTLAATADGLAAAWHGGNAEDGSDLGIWCARFDGVSWSVPERVAGGNGEPCLEPVLVRLENGELLLFYKTGALQGRTAVFRRSGDDGRTWSPPQPLPNGIAGPSKNKPMALPDGSFLYPSERDGEVVMLIAGDPTKSWKTVGPLAKPKSWRVSQPALMRFKDRSIHAFCRSNQGFIVEVKSKDNGLNWTYMERTKFPNPDAPIDGIDLRDGRHLLVYNRSKSALSPLNVSIANKRGTAWKNVLRLEEGDGEFFSPAAVQTADGLVHILYIWNRTAVKHAVIDPMRL